MTDFAPAAKSPVFDCFVLVFVLRDKVLAGYITVVYTCIREDERIHTATYVYRYSLLPMAYIRELTLAKFY